MHPITHTTPIHQEHLPCHRKDGNKVSLTMVGNKPDACETFKLGKGLHNDPAAGFIWERHTMTDPLRRSHSS